MGIRPDHNLEAYSPLGQTFIRTELPPRSSVQLLFPTPDPRPMNVFLPQSRSQLNARCILNTQEVP
jgi:hypothetical protein